MRTKEVAGGLALVLWLTLPAGAEPPQMVPAAHGEMRRSADDPAHRTDRQRGGWDRHFRRSEPRHERPLISIALRHAQELALTPAQVEGLHGLRTDFRREAIKRQADQRLAKLDLAALLRPDTADPGKPVDMGRVEAKVREIERLRADSEIARIRTIEQGKALLTAEQREKLKALLAAPRPPAGRH